MARQVPVLWDELYLLTKLSQKGTLAKLVPLALMGKIVVVPQFVKVKTNHF